MSSEYIMPQEPYDIKSRTNEELLEDLEIASGWVEGSYVAKQGKAWKNRLAKIRQEILKRMNHA